MKNLLLLQEKIKASTPGRLMLKSLSLAYLAAVAMRSLLYKLGILRSYSLPARVICFGNITTGGTGKTSAVMLAAGCLAEKGESVAILTRGYKRPSGKKGITTLHGEEELSWQECGDEPWMMYHWLKDLKVPVLVSPDRYSSGLEALKRFKSRILIMDDGFQHFRLRRDMDIVLIDARNPFGGGELLPLGRLREPASGLKRASAVLITHCDQVKSGELVQARKEILAANPKITILESVHHPEFYLNLHTSEKLPVEELKGQAAAFSAIGEPASFEQTLTTLGLKLKQIWRYPDHHPFSEEEIRSINTLRGDYPLITTFKDFPRLPAQWRSIMKNNVYALAIRLKIRNGGDKLFINTMLQETD